MAGMEDQIREMEQRLAAQFQQQLLQSQEGQRLQLETLTSLVTQQRVAGTELEQQVAGQQRAGQGLLQEVAAQRAEGQQILEQRDELRAAGQELEAEREGMRGAGAALEQQVADLQRRALEAERQVNALREERNAAVSAATQAAEAFAQLQATAGDLDDLRAGGGGAGDRPVQGRDKRLLSNLFEAGKAPMLGEKASSQEQLEGAWGDFAFVFELRLLRGLENADRALRFAE